MGLATFPTHPPDRRKAHAAARTQSVCGGVVFCQDHLGVQR